MTTEQEITPEMLAFAKLRGEAVLNAIKSLIGMAFSSDFDVMVIAKDKACTDDSGFFLISDWETYPEMEAIFNTVIDRAKSNVMHDASTPGVTH